MNNSLADLKLTIRNFVASTSFSDISKLNDDTLIFHEGLFDSMGFMSLLSFLEEKFQIGISDSDLVEENFESINAIVNFISGKNDVYK